MYSRFGWTLDPWRELRALENAVEKAFDRGPRVGAGGGFPAVNVISNGVDAVLRAEVPGLKPEEMDISVKGRTVTIAGERKPDPLGEGETYHRHERWQGRFSRTLEMPFGIEPEKVHADYRHGVLTVTLPRAEAEKPRKITIGKN